MPPANFPVQEKNDNNDVYDIETARLPLLAQDAPPQHHSFVSKTLNAFWNSCTCCALMGSFCLASAFVALKVLSEEVSVFQITVIRSLMALPILVPFGYFQTGMTVGPRDNMMLIVLRGFFGAGGFLFAGISTILLSLSEASLLNNSYPALLAFLLWMFRIEDIDLLSWIGILGTLIAQALIARPPILFGEDDNSWDLERISGILSSFTCCLSMSIGFIIVGKIDKKVPSIVIANHAAFQLILVSMPFLILGIPKPVIWNPSAFDCLLYFIAACSQLNQVFLVRSFQIGPPTKAAMLSLTRVPMMVIAGGLILNEEVTLFHAIGGALLLACIALVIWSKSRSRAESAQQRHSREETAPLLASDDALSDDL